MGILKTLGTALGTAVLGPGVGTAIGTAVGSLGDQALGGGSSGGGLTAAAGGHTQLVNQLVPIQTSQRGQNLPPLPSGIGGLTPPSTQPQPSVPAVPQNGQMQSQITQLLGGNQIIMNPSQKVINSAPPGWVIVTMPSGEKKAVLKDVAKCLGLWKPRRKPPISAADWSKLKRAEAVKKKAKRIAEVADFTCRKRK